MMLNISPNRVNWLQMPTLRRSRNPVLRNVRKESYMDTGQFLTPLSPKPNTLPTPTPQHTEGCALDTKVLVYPHLYTNIYQKTDSAPPEI